jgi:hypothetical protein
MPLSRHVTQVQIASLVNLIMQSWQLVHLNNSDAFENLNAVWDHIFWRLSTFHFLPREVREKAFNFALRL